MPAHWRRSGCLALLLLPLCLRAEVADNPDVKGAERLFESCLRGQMGIHGAGMIVESLSGERWGDYVQKHIFGPLGKAVRMNAEESFTGRVSP